MTATRRSGRQGHHVSAAAPKAVVVCRRGRVVQNGRRCKAVKGAGEQARVATVRWCVQVRYAHAGSMRSVKGEQRKEAR